MHALDCNVHAKTAATQLWRGGFSQPTKESLDSHVAYIHWSTACYEEGLSIFLHLCDKGGTDCRILALDEHTGHVCHAASVTISGLFSSLSPGMRQSTCACILTAIRKTCALILKPYLCNQDIAVNAAINVGAALHANKTVLLGVVEPMSCPPGPDQALQLVGLHPDELIHSLVAPDVQALPSQLHCTPCSRFTVHRMQLT